MGVIFFVFNDTATTEIYTLSLPRRSSDLAGIRSRTMARVAATWMADGKTSLDDCEALTWSLGCIGEPSASVAREATTSLVDRKSTRLNSSHANISYAVSCLTKKTIFSTYA